MISIVIPTYNELKNLENLVSRIDAALKNSKYEIIIVDDNSPDGTGELAEKLSSKYSIKVIHRKGKLGLSSAVIEGFNKANGSIIGAMDADLGHPPEILPQLIKPIEEKKADLVIASRLIKGGGAQEWPLHRILISRVATLLAKPLTKVKDPMSGCFFFKREILSGVQLNPIGYKILLEVLVKAKFKNFVEVPYIFMNRGKGKSKLGLQEHINYLRHLFRLYKFKLGF